MNETINNEIEMENIETTEIEMDNVIPFDRDVCNDESIDGGNLGAVIFGISALAAAAIGGGIAIAKKKNKDGERKEGFIKKIAIKYLTKNGYIVEQVESGENDEGNEDEDDYNGLIPDKK